MAVTSFESSFEIYLKKKDSLLVSLPIPQSVIRIEIIPFPKENMKPGIDLWFENNDGIDRNCYSFNVKVGRIQKPLEYSELGDGNYFWYSFIEFPDYPLLITIQIQYRPNSSNSFFTQLKISEMEEKNRLYAECLEDGNICLYPKKLKKVDNMEDAPNKKRKLNNGHSEKILNKDVLDNENDGVRVYAGILKSVSNVFKGILKNGKEAKDKSICIDTDSKKHIEDMLYFIIVGELKDDFCLWELVKLAHLYDIGKMFNACMESLHKQLKVDNFINLVLIHEKYGVRKGYEDLHKFGKENLKELQKLTRYDELPLSCRVTLEG